MDILKSWGNRIISYFDIKGKVGRSIVFIVVVGGRWDFYGGDKRNSVIF